MSKKSEKIAAMIDSSRGGDFDAHYLAYFECFNRQLFFEAHDVLEHLWLAERKGPNDLFYKGLIQLAGAFVHFQKNRLQPAFALLKLAQANLSQYPLFHEGLETGQVRQMIGAWLDGRGHAGQSQNPLSGGNHPLLTLPVRPPGQKPGSDDPP